MKAHRRKWAGRAPGWPTRSRALAERRARARKAQVADARTGRAHSPTPRKQSAARAMIENIKTFTEITRKYTKYKMH